MIYIMTKLALALFVEYYQNMDKRTIITHIHEQAFKLYLVKIEILVIIRLIE